MSVFNFGVESPEQSVKLDRLVILISSAIPLFKHHSVFQTDNQRTVLFTVFPLLELFFSCYVYINIIVSVAK